MTERDYNYPEWDYGSKNKFLAGNLESDGSWYNISKKITRRGEYGGVENSLAVRAEHAKYFKQIVNLRDKIKTADENEKIKLRSVYKEVAQEMAIFDNLAWQFQTQRQKVEVNLDKLGVQAGLVVTLRPKNIDLQKRPLVIIPGISSNIEGVGAFPIKLAMKSRQSVTVISHPESWMGRVTEEFSQAVEKSSNLKPHTDFFMSAINQTIGTKNEFDIVGISAGGMIINEMTKNEDFNQRIGKISLIAPPGLTDMKKKTNVAKALTRLIRDIHFDPRYTTSILKSVTETEEQRRLQLKTFRGIKQHLSREYDWWNNKSLYQNREVGVILGTSDAITLGGIYGPKKIDSNNFKLTVIKGGYHGMYAREPEKIIEKMSL
jgi:hypothetical protein